MTSPDFLEKLAAYVPMPVAQAIHRQPRPLTRPIARRFPAAVLFADISGFTPLSELLGRNGATGSEELTRLINQYFTRMIRIVESYQGQVVKFSGDAITVIFPADSSSPAEAEGSTDAAMQVAVCLAGECALAMQAEMGHFSDIKTSQGRAFLSMRVGIGAGKILECSIGGALGRWEYVVGGDPVVQVATAEHKAEPGQIILSPQAWKMAEASFAGKKLEKGHGFVHLQQVVAPLPKSMPVALDWGELSPEGRQLAEQALQCYIPGAIKARLNQQSEWLAELRRMTILFVGVGGFDYEAANVSRQLQNLLQATQEVIYRYEGSLGKVAVDDKGTVLLILFGAPPFSHEDDATRAVACALGLQAVAREQNLKMAIGLTEGPIFAGPVGSPNRREYTVIGDQVNLASRLMQYGRGGAIIVSERVKERAGPRFITESLGQISVRGKAKALTAHLIKGEEGVQDEIMNRYLLHEDPLVGRKAALEQIRRVANRARSGKRQLLFIEGELGLGKSRLAAEMVREWIMAGGAGYGSRCVSYGQQMLYQGWREVLAGIFGLTRSLSTEQQLARLATGLADLPAPPNQPNYWSDRLPLLADLLGLKAPENGFTRHISSELRRYNTFSLIETILRHQAEHHNLLILLEDIHWADELSLSLAAYLAQSLIDCPLLLVLIHRPMPAKDLRPLAGVKSLPATYTIHLDPLSEQESLDLIRILLDDVSHSPEAEELVLRRGQGNPFFIYEITGAIQDAIKRQQKQSAKVLDDLDLPDTVQDVILSRVDRLSDDEKLTLKIASVLGTSFQRVLLSEIHPMSDAQVVLPTQLDKLEAEKLLRLEAPAPKWEYVFRNVIAQEVVYEGLLLAQRHQLHAAVGEALEILTPDEIEQLAFHYSRSDNWAKALHYLKIAGQKACREYANHAAIGYYSEMLTCLANRTAEEGSSIVSTDYWDAILERAKLYNLIGQRDEELEDLGTLGIMAEAINDDRRRALAAKQWAYLYETSGDYDSGLELIERWVQMAQKAGDEKLVGEGYNQWGKLLYLRGRYELATDYLERAWHIAQRHQDKIAQADCLLNRGTVAHYQADYEIALLHFQDAMHLWRTIGDQVGLANSLCHLGQVYYDMGQYILAQQCYDQSLTLHRAAGNRAGEALTQHNLGKVHRTLGNYPVARRLFEEALVFYQHIGDRHLEAYSLYHLGFLHCRLTDYKTATIFLEESLAILKELRAPWWAQVKALIYYSWVLHDKGAFQEAKTYITEALEVERDTQQKVEMIEDMALLGRISLSLDELRLADLCAQQVLSFIEQQGMQGIEHPTMVYLTCYDILRASQNYKQAQLVLSQGQEDLLARTAQIDDPVLRENYLTNIPENQALQALTKIPEAA